MNLSAVAVGREFVSPSTAVAVNERSPSPKKNCHQTIMLLHCAVLVCKCSVKSAVLGTIQSLSKHSCCKNTLQIEQHTS